MATNTAWALVHAVDDAQGVMALYTHLKSAHPGVATSAFAALDVLMRAKMSTRNALTVVKTATPPIVERLGDAAEQARPLVLRAADVAYGIEAGAVREADAPHTALERILRESLAHASPRVRTEVLQLLPDVRAKWPRMHLRPFLPVLVSNVQAADAGVRAAARSAVGTLFASAPNAAQSDVRTALEEAGVRKPVVDAIMGVVEQGHSPAALASSHAAPPLPAGLAEVPMDDVKRVMLYDRHDVDRLFDPAPFAGRESEENWQPRKRAIVALRSVLRDGVPAEYEGSFLAHVRTFQDAILKALATLRTTLSMHTIYLIRQLALTYAHELDHTLDAFFTALIRMAGFTKKMVATASQVAVSTILATVPLRSVHWSQIQQGMGDKSAATRVHMVKHLNVVLQMHAHRRGAIEAHGGLDALTHCIARALGDQNVEVRTTARDTFLLFHSRYPAQATSVLDVLPPAARKQTAAMIDKPSEPKKARTGASSTVLAAKRAAILANSPRRDESEVRAKPRASVWHPSLAETPSDASSDLMGGTSPWGGEAPQTPKMKQPTIAFASGNVAFTPPIEQISADAQRAAHDATASASQLSSMVATLETRADGDQDVSAAAEQLKRVGLAEEKKEEEEGAVQQDEAMGKADETAAQETAKDKNDEATDNAETDKEKDGTEAVEAVADVSVSNVTETADTVDESRASAPGAAAKVFEAEAKASAAAPEAVGPSAQEPTATTISTHTPATSGSVPPTTPRALSHASESPGTPGASLHTPHPSTPARYFLARCDREDALAGPTPLAVCLERIAAREADVSTLRDVARRMTEADAFSAWPLSMDAFLDHLETYTSLPPDDVLWPPALFVAYRIVQHGYAHLAREGVELRYLTLVLNVQKETRAGYSLAQGASRAMLDAWAQQSDPVLASDVLRTALRLATSHVLAPGAQAAMHASAMHAFGTLFSRIPPALLSDELPRTADVVQLSLSDPHPAVRRSAIGALVQAQTGLQDLPRLVSLYSLSRTQTSLLEASEPDEKVSTPLNADDAGAPSNRTNSPFRTGKRRWNARESKKKRPRSMTSPKESSRPKGGRSERRDRRRASQEPEEDMWYDDEDDAMDEELDEAGLGHELGFDLNSLSGLFGGLSSRFRQLLQALQRSAHDRTARLLALQELSEVLSMATEDTLLGQFPTDAIVAELVASLGGAEPDRPAAIEELDEDQALAAVLAATGSGDDSELEVYACRCIAHLLEALPESAQSVVRHGAVPLLIEKLQEITFIDLAEQVLQTLEKLSATHAQAIVRHGGMQAMLQYIDFFSLYVQRTAMGTAANCCRHLTPAMASRAVDIAPILQNVLSYSDMRLVEAATRALCSMIEAYADNAELLEQLLLETDLVAPAAALLTRATGKASGPALGATAYADLLHALALAAKASTGIAQVLYEHHAIDLCYFLLTGATDDAPQPTATDVLQNLARRSPAQVQEALFLATELLPALPRDGIFDSKAYSEKALSTLERRAAREGCAIGELGEDLDDAPARRVSASAARHRRMVEERATAQAAWPGFYAHYCRRLLPTMVEVYAATVAPGVRAKIFSGLLKMLHYAEPGTLRESVHDVPLASFLAGVLAAREPAGLMQSALQAVELLVARLPSIYDTLLVREGALHEIGGLAQGDGAQEVVWRAKIVEARLSTRLASGQGVDRARTILASLQKTAERIRDAGDSDAAKSVLDELADVLTNTQPVSSFELLHSGLVDQVYAFATSERHAVPLAERRRMLATTLAYLPDGASSSAGYRFVRRLHQSLSRLEDLHVAGTVLDTPASLAQQLRLRLEADEATAEALPRTFRSLMVSIHGVATVQALHDFLRPKIEMALSRRGMPALSEVLAALAGADKEEKDESSSRLLDQLFDGEMEVGKVEDKEANVEAAGTPSEARDEAKAEKAPEPKDAPESSRRSYASAVQSPENAWHIAFSLEETPMPLHATLYGCVHRLESARNETKPANTVYTIRFQKVDGPAPEAPEEAPPAPATEGYEVALPPSIKPDAPYARILQLLGAIHGLADDGVYAGSPFALNDQAFINNKLTAKLAQQLHEPLIVASACLPAWAHELPERLSFLFSFETRYAYFQATAFGHARLLSHYKKTDPGPFDDVLSMLAQLPRQKVRIARDSLLPSAVKVLELYSAGAYLLEVEYFDEVGSGLGPTLEFYALVSKEFARADLGLWRADETSEVGGVTYVHPKQGLFPVRIGDKGAKLFTTLGQFVAKSLLDARIIDVPLNPVFVRKVLGQRVEPTLATLRQVDAALARSLEALQTMPAAELEALAMDYAVPGSGESLGDGVVTAANVDAYVRDVASAVLDIGGAVDAFRTGFAGVLSLDTLRVFAAEELVLLLGHADEDWSEAALRRALVPDHGFSGESSSFLDLVAILAAYTPEERRAFLQWLTGSPRLPIGGFAGLHPPLTVVRRDHEAPLQPDDYLPSVMTCVNYLKLPCYSSRDVMQRRLQTAVREGLTSFHLS